MPIIYKEQQQPKSTEFDGSDWNMIGKYLGMGNSQKEIVSMDIEFGPDGRGTVNYEYTPHRTIEFHGDENSFSFTVSNNLDPDIIRYLQNKERERGKS